MAAATLQAALTAVTTRASNAYQASANFVAAHKTAAKVAVVGTATAVAGFAAYKFYPVLAPIVSECMNPAQVCKTVEETVPAVATEFLKNPIQYMGEVVRYYDAPKAGVKFVQECVDAAPTVCQKTVSFAKANGLKILGGFAAFTGVASLTAYAARTVAQWKAPKQD